MNSLQQPTIRELMTPEPAGIDEDLTLADAVDRMIANNIRHLLVTRDGVLIGTVDAADLALASSVAGGSIDEVAVTSAMRGVFTCPPDMPVADVVRTMEANHYTCAAVVDDRHRVVGIFTTTDALRTVRQLASGHAVAPEVYPTVAPQTEPMRQQPPVKVRISRMLRERGAAPSPDQGLAFGRVGL